MSGGERDGEEQLLIEAEELIRGTPSPEEALEQLALWLRERVRRFSWAGFYLLREGTLVLGPHSDHDHPPHALELPLDQGPQGLAACWKETVVLPDLRRSDRWLSCPAVALSEIVVPIKDEGALYGEVDVDSRRLNGFDRRDREFLETLSKMLIPLFRS